MTIHTTTARKWAAVWQMDDGLVHVIGIVPPGGQPRRLDGLPTLGGAFHSMPRFLWDEIQYDRKHGPRCDTDVARMFREGAL